MAYLKCKPIENAMLKLLNINNVMNAYFSNILPSFYSILTLWHFFDITVTINATINYTIKTNSITFMLPMKEPLYLIADIFIGTLLSLLSYAMSKLKPFICFQFKIGLKYMFTYALSAKLKYANCSTPNSYSPTILMLIIEINITI